MSDKDISLCHLYLKSITMRMFAHNNNHNHQNVIHVQQFDYLHLIIYHGKCDLCSNNSNVYVVDESTK